MQLDKLIYILLLSLFGSTVAMDYVFERAGIPYDQQDEYHFVIARESLYDHTVIPEGGDAVGLLQIKPMWETWANDLDIPGEMTFTDRSNPVQNVRLAYLINERYDCLRGTRWRQWRHHSLPYDTADLDEGLPCIGEDQLSEMVPVFEALDDEYHPNQFYPMRLALMKWLRMAGCIEFYTSLNESCAY